MGCTCMEIRGEDAECPVHGIETAWALENLTSQEWQEAAVKHRAAIAALQADKARLDYLDRCNAALNAHYGTAYSWRLIQSHNVNRLMLGNYYDVDLNDSQPHGLPSCRDAIDERMQNSGRAAA